LRIAKVIKQKTMSNSNTPPPPLNWLYKFWATGFGSGYTPVAPGTAGAVVGVILIWLSNYFFFPNAAISFPVFLSIATIIFFFIGVFCTDKLEAEWGKDPSKVVIDEIIGVWIGMLWLPIEWPWLLAAFVLFRFFDILKPLGIRKLEAIPGGMGVMLDDVLAGVYTLVVLQVAFYFLSM